MVDDAYVEYMRNKNYESGLKLFKNKNNVKYEHQKFGLASLESDGVMDLKV